MRNVEIKAKVNDIDAICKIAQQLSGSPPTLIQQDDTFYKVNKGRLKMRVYADDSATLVRYDRDDEEGPKLCDYDLFQFSVNDRDKSKYLDDILKKCCGTRGRVVKERRLYMVGQTRIHIDKVQNLGNFMELEVVLRPEQSLEDGQDIARDLQNKLGVKEEDLIDCAYVDLLDKNT
ncbi:uncharacterized protein LOC120635222 [Pararge aegeria]|uniref:Jg1473 protein n=2 Tax=Pararge aegeria TaxID=116150 RepID=A0A8S4RFM7_9NEOP|nr:uncharacterized protein LOC120635222 [Pararge aegeria]CAH2235698.1 jg1473 [Pararge aegeria aegeria]